MTTTTADLRTLDQIRAGIRHDARGMHDRRVARRAVTTATYRRRLRHDPDIQARVEAAVVADEWKALAAERRRRAAA